MNTKNKRDLRRLQNSTFLVVTLGIIFDPKTRKILIGKRRKDPYIKKLSWSFPGGAPGYNADLERSLEKIIFQKTGLKVKNLGCVFARIFKENKKVLLMYYLCETISRSIKPKGDLEELKWVSPEGIEKHFTTSLDSRLKEYLMNLK
ncbi:NUDIX hydrolase [Candidatus Pacearchaeota archaeon]|nr:NUDIX hydrolase [Candidatus Pacearchaeota archaeon]